MKLVEYDGNELLVMTGIKSIKEARKHILNNFTELSEEDPDSYEELKEEVNNLEVDEQFWPQDYAPDCNSIFMIV